MLAANHERAYAVVASKEQSVYAIAGTLLVADGGASRLEYLAEKYRKRQTADNIANTLAQYPSKETGSILVAGYKKGIELHRVSLAAGTASELCSYTPADTETVVTLTDPARYLIPFVAQREAPFQFGLLTKDGARTLHAPETELKIRSPNYRGSFRAETSQPYYQKLLDALATSDTKRVTKVIDAFLNEDYCAIDRTIHVISGAFHRLFFPLLPKAAVDERTRDILASKQEYGSALISVRPDLQMERREELAANVSRIYKLPCTALMTSPTLVLKGDKNEVENVSSRLQLSRPCTNTLRAITDVRPSRIRVAPLPKPKRKCAPTERLRHVEMLNAYAAHRETQGEGVIGAVMDTGVDYTHPSLQQNFEDVKGYDFVRNTDDPFDREGHGTHVAGIWASVAPRVILRAVRVLDELGRGSEADILLGYEYCYKNGIPLINCSFGSEWASDQERRVVEAAQEYGCIIVSAAGNESENERSPDLPSYPAAFAGVQSVGSVDTNWKHSWFSNMGYVTFVALGEDVLSTLPGNEWGTMDGTSMASPSIAGALTLQLAATPDLSLEDRLMIAKARCQQFGTQNEEWKRRFGFGMPDCELYVEQASLWTGTSK
ncbi:MAG TPA: S8 family serine peptidase [Candidatus Binatia bacterium]|nr:S8 family serine peptidase [Candidatus Binatia bacterium]